MRLDPQMARWVLWIVILRQVFRYLEPGSGSLIIQIIIAVVLGGLATITLWKDRILNLFHIKKSSSHEERKVSASAIESGEESKGE